MATYRIYKLRFSSPLHINDQRGSEGVSQRIVHSDVMYAALMSCLARTGCEIPDDGDLGFTISSLFPYYQAGKADTPVYFLPIPRLVSFPSDVDPSMRKMLKKVQWVDASLYADVLAGKPLIANNSESLSHIQGAYYTKQTLAEDGMGSHEFVHSEMVQRVKIEDRTGRSDAFPYYVDRVSFRDNAGFYFIAEGNTELLDRAIRILSLEGIGSDRNVGFGFFDYSVSQLSIDIPTEADHVVTLSLMIPANEPQLAQMMDSPNASYDFVRRGGWITTPPYGTLRKNAIYAFLPGSVFHKIEEPESYGKVVDLCPEVGEATPNHPIWRCGKAITLPIKC